jgi:transcriptional regulator with XRE-family HTH domain
MATPEEQVCDLLAQKIREVTRNGKGLSYAELDRRVGKGSQGWARQFVKGRASTTFPGTPALGTVLRVLKELNLGIGAFFSEALEEATEISDAAILRTIEEAAKRRFQNLEERVKQIEFELKRG